MVKYTMHIFFNTYNYTHTFIINLGYRFPELKDSSVAALAPSQSLKSAEELEEEDRVAQSAVRE